MVLVAHEALFNSWPRLAKWIQETRDLLTSVRQTRAATKEWIQSGRDDAFLWTYERRNLAREALGKLRYKPNDSEIAFLNPEIYRLLDEVTGRQKLSHIRRSWVGEQIARGHDYRIGWLTGSSVDLYGIPEIDWCRVPAAKVTLGLQGPCYDITSFEISKYPVTHIQYISLVSRGVRAFDDLKHLHPVVNVSWFEAVEFCRQLSQALGYEVRLPTEAEWQLAASGGDQDNVYPWGARWQSHFANTFEGWSEMQSHTSAKELCQPIAVGMFPHGRSPVGAYDMSGNVHEWCLPESDDQEGDAGRTRPVRGGSWFHWKEAAKARTRDHLDAFIRYPFVGFRLVCRFVSEAV
jgi:hypothetical protein